MDNPNTDPERILLHDLANKLVVAQGMTQGALKRLQNTENSDPEVVRKLGKAVDALKTMNDYIKARREAIVGKI